MGCRHVSGGALAGCVWALGGWGWGSGREGAREVRGDPKISGLGGRAEGGGAVTQMGSQKGGEVRGKRTSSLCRCLGI